MASLKKCVEQHCKNCTYDSTQPGSWRQQTENCTVVSCALWPVRPVTMESLLAARKDKKGEMDALIAGLEDEEDSE